MEEQINRLLVVVAHQDDEILFFGGLLSKLRDKSNIMIVTVFEPAKKRKDTLTRVDAFIKLVAHLGVQGVCLNSQDIRPLPKDDYYLTCSCLLGIVYGFAPDTIITHNHMGDYGHSQHREVNEMVREITHKADPSMRMPRVLTTDVGIEQKPDFVVEYDRKEKEKLFSFYAPQWNPKDYKFAYKPEGYINICKL